MIFLASVSPEDEARAIADFFKIIKSLCDNASSYLYQKGIISGDNIHQELKNSARDNSVVESVIHSLLRPNSRWQSHLDFEAMVAVLLIQWCKEANQIFSEIYEAKGRPAGMSRAMLALAHQMALIDRATACLKLPSINDHNYWGVQSLRQSCSVSEEEIVTTKAKPVVTRPAPVPEMKPPEVKKPEVKKPEVKQPEAKKPEAKKPEVTKSTQPKVEQAKAEGPVKATVRRILRHIEGETYEDVLDAFQDEEIMEELYYTDDDPIPIAVVTVDTKKRKVIYKKRKKQEEESVTFLNLRKIFSEL